MATYREADGLLPLDSPRWGELRHAFGAATEVPEWIREVAEEAEPELCLHPRDMRVRPSAWDQMLTAVIHQGSLYSVTYAVTPHLVEIAARGSWRQRELTLYFLGELCVHGRPSDPVPPDLEPAHARALVRAREWSRETLRRFRDSPSWVFLLEAHAGLRYPSAAEVRTLTRVDENDGELEVDCLACGRPFDVEVAVPSDDPRVEAARVAGAAYVTSDDDWPAAQTAAVIAALAMDCARPDIAGRVLGFDDELECPYCSATRPPRELAR